MYNNGNHRDHFSLTNLFLWRPICEFSSPFNDNKPQRLSKTYFLKDSFPSSVKHLTQFISKYGGLPTTNHVSTMSTIPQIGESSTTMPGCLWETIGCPKRVRGNKADKLEYYQDFPIFMDDIKQLSLGIIKIESI